MLRNYIKLAVRNLLKHKLFTFINVMGLCLGLSSGLILFMHIFSEYSYDKHLNDFDRIYRVRCDNLVAGEYSERMAVTNGPVGGAIRDLFPEVEYVVQLNRDNLDGLISQNGFTCRLQKSFFASSDFFKVFSYKLLQGDKASALTEINSIVLSKSMARKFFGDEDPMNKSLRFNNHFDLKVTGVFEDVPENSHLKFDMLIPYTFMIKYVAPYMEQEWDSGETNYTYIKLKPGADPGLLEKKFTEMVQQKLGAYLKGKNHDKQYFLQSVTDIHLNSHFDSEIEVNGNGQAVKFFIIIALLILVIAWINYINLSTAKSFERFREIGIRVVSGANKIQIRAQFILEALMLNTIALLLSVLIARMVIPYFSDYTGMHIQPEVWRSKSIWLVFVITALTGAAISSLYPAFILTSLNAVTVLKSKVQAKAGKGFLFRKMLLAFQFAISFALITGTIIVYKQVNYMRNQDRGLNIDQTLVLHKPYVFDTTWTKRFSGFRNTLLANPAIANVSISRYVPGEPINYSQGYVLQGQSSNQLSQLLYSNFFDENFISLYGLKLIAGRDFIHGKRDLELIINRKALKTLGFKTPQEAINQKVYNEGWKYTHTIVGVIKDFHQRSVKEDYLPMSYMHFSGPELANSFSVKIHTGNMRETMAFVEKTWKQFFPGNTFEYSFLDQQYNAQYKSDIQFGTIFLFFSSLAIIIACIGLFALTLFTIQQRSKEVAIRKVIGASVSDLFRLLTRDYFAMLFIAAAVAFPVIYWIMNGWLQNFAGRISLSWILFVPSVFALTGMILLSVSFHALKAACANPVKSLRTE